MDVKTEIQPLVQDGGDAPTAEPVKEDEIKTEMGDPNKEKEKAKRFENQF